MPDHAADAGRARAHDQRGQGAGGGGARARADLPRVGGLGEARARRSRCWSRTRKIRCARSSCCTRSPSCTRCTSSSRARAFDACARALPLDNAQRAHAGRARAAGRAARRCGRERGAAVRPRDRAPARRLARCSRSTWRCALAKICEVQLGSVDAAIARYRIVLEVDPAHLEALEALDRLYEASERWPELAEVLAREKPRSRPAPSDVLQLQFRLGQLHQTPARRRRARDRAVPRDPRRGARARAARCSALEDLFDAGRRARRRSARSSSRSTGCRTPGTS